MFIQITSDAAVGRNSTDIFTSHMFTQNFTIAAWINPAQLPSYDFGQFMTCNSRTVFNDQILPDYFEIAWSYSDADVSNKIVVNTGWSGTHDISTQAISLNRWTHFAYVQILSNNYVFVNGTLALAGSSQAYQYNNPNDKTMCVIGINSLIAYDDLYIFNRGLSAVEVLSVMNTANSGKY